MKTCPCAQAVPINYSRKDRDQARFTLRIIEQMGEYVTIQISDRRFRVSRHCIALHGIKAAEILSYGFEELP